MAATKSNSTARDYRRDAPTASGQTPGAEKGNVKRKVGCDTGIDCGGNARRETLKVGAKVGNSRSVTGYIESDSNGYQPPHAQDSSNSDTFRLRLLYAKKPRNTFLSN